MKKNNYKPLSKLLNTDKIPPQAIDFEESVLGAILVDGVDCIRDCHSIFRPEVFYKNPHATICEAILIQKEKGEPIDSLTIMQRLRVMGELENIGGAFYLTELTNKISSSANTHYHLRIVFQKYIAREIIKVCHQTTMIAYEENEDIFNLLDKVISELEELDVHKKETVITSLKSSLETLFNKYESNEFDEFFQVGSPLLDTIFSLGTKDILLLGGKSGAGKTRFTCWMMLNLLKKFNNKVSIMWCNMEDDTPKMIRCFISIITRLTNDQLVQKDYTLSAKDMYDIGEAKKIIESFDIEFLDTNKHIAEISKVFHYFCVKRKNKFCILIIDNLMLLKDNSEKGNQTEKDDKIAMTVKQITIDNNRNGLKSAVIMLHHFTDEQLSSINIKTGYRPRDNHLKGSTRYRDISTIVMLINRPSNYPDLMNAYKHIKAIMDYIYLVDITKNRNSKVGLIRFFGNLGINYFKEIHN